MAKLAYRLRRSCQSSASEAGPKWTESAKATEGSHISVTSEFFPDDMSVDIRLSVRDTDEWQKVKDDLIFVEFEKTAVTVPLLTVIANRDRPDPVTEQLEPVIQHRDDMPEASHPSHVQQSVAGADDEQSDGDQAMDMSDDDDEPVKPVLQPTIQPLAHPLPRPVTQSAPPVKQVTILDTLELALGPKSPRKNDRQPPRSARHSRSRSPEKRSRQGSQQPKAKPAPLPKDTAQENILAALGVEGSPKMVYPTPPPALGLPVPPGNRKKITPPGGFAPPNGRFAYGPQFPPPPPPRESRSPSFDPWRAHDPASPKSTTSQHTAAGSDFHGDDVMVDLDATPKAKVPVAAEKSGSGRKRTYEETRCLQPLPPVSACHASACLSDFRHKSISFASIFLLSVFSTRCMRAYRNVLSEQANGREADYGNDFSSSPPLHFFYYDLHLLHWTSAKYRQSTKQKRKAPTNETTNRMKDLSRQFISVTLRLGRSLHRLFSSPSSLSLSPSSDESSSVSPSSSVSSSSSSVPTSSSSDSSVSSSDDSSSSSSSQSSNVFSLAGAPDFDLFVSVLNPVRKGSRATEAGGLPFFFDAFSAFSQCKYTFAATTNKDT
ncbi:hypothetical protein KCU87_g213, partial [Aureobasidium melanogenum]